MQPNKPRAAHPVRVVPLRPVSGSAPARTTPAPAAPAAREPLWRDLVGEVLRRERLAQDRTLKDVAEAARISMPYLSELERGRKEASSEVLAAAAQALGLGLADLLALAQGELVRLAARTTVRRSGPSGAPYGGLCLAA
jgi:hypothetical protein